MADEGITYYLGIDVSKDKLDCCLLSGNGKIRKNACFNNTKKGIERLQLWAIKYAQDNKIHAILEPTSSYHESCATFIDRESIYVSLVNPRCVRDFAKALNFRSKTDALDSFILASFGQKLQPPQWFPVAAHIDELEQLRTHKVDLINTRAHWKNRLHATSYKENSAQVLDSINEQIFFMDEQIKKIDGKINKLINSHEELRQDNEILQSIPGIGPEASRVITSCLRSHSFATGSSLVSYCGLAPIEKQSGTSVYAKPHIPRAGYRDLKRILYMAAMAAIKYNPHIKQFYERLIKKGKAKKVILVAAMRKLLLQCYGVWRSRSKYDSNYNMDKINQMSKAA